jgi:threonine aldolase
MIRGFGSDNFSGVLPEVFKALEEAAYGHQHSYEEDVYSEKAIQDFKNVFGENIRVFFVYNGTGANILSLSAFTHSYNAVICAETAHINVDECGAIEKQSGLSKTTCTVSENNITHNLK